MRYSRRIFSIITLLIAGQVMLLNYSVANSPMVFSNNDVAINGYDPVAYFIEGKPVKGKVEYAVEWKGATWLFSDMDNQSRFEMSPSEFAPQYGGYCAYAVSRGYTAMTVPEAWRIVNNKLYLNYSLGVRRIWEKNTAENIRKANKNWPDVLEK
ncbi:MAG: YHS domain protein [Aestuariivita sp.]|nr:YHS domain protein [Aestuariivita sp.]